MPKLHIHIGHHFFGAGNLGDDLMLAGFLAAAGPALVAELTLTCCIPHDARSQQRRFPQIYWLPYDDATRDAAVARCDVWLGLGDTPFQIVVGPWFLDHLGQEAAACRRHGKPMFYLGVGVNEREVIDDPRLRVLVGQAQKIWTRDAASAEILRPLAAPGKVTVGADLAHAALAAMRFPSPEPDTLGLLLNFEDAAQYRPAQIAALIADSPASGVAWLSQEVRPLPGAEAALYEELPASARARAIPRLPDYAGAETPGDLVGAWGAPGQLFTSRYHGALIGAWLGCRTVAFARNAKVAGGARQLGLPLVADLGDTGGILRALEAAGPVPATLLQAQAELARGACDAFFSLATAHHLTRPVPARARLASLPELESPSYGAFMERMNAFATVGHLRQFTNWSKIWEYPWLWEHALESIDWPGQRLVDLGSEISPMPWFLATLGARVTLIETDPQWIPRWEALRQRLRVDVDWHIVASELLPLPDAGVDVVTSFSVIEHQPDKSLAVDEVARVLKPGGRLAISFDICEPDLGMTFPEWNGRALTLREFEDFVWKHPAFDAGPGPAWNLADLPKFRRWHLQSAPHHNYVVGAAVLTRRAVSAVPPR